MVMTEIASFITVLVVAVCVASSIGLLYASGLRLWAGSVAGDESDATGNYLIKRVCSALCFAACVAIVLFALWLMIPLFH